MAINTFMQKLAYAPLYEKITLQENEWDILEKYLDYDNIANDSIDIYCTLCQEQSIFRPVNCGQISSMYSSSYSFSSGILPMGILHFHCTRETNHYFGIIIKLIGDNVILKVGQYPSKADIELPDYNQYSKIVPEAILSDIKRAVGLASHGIGAGSYVYIRRVVEYFLNEAFSHANMDGAISEDAYTKSRVMERIMLLRDYLPEILVANKEAYSILSKGIHELTEEECLASFTLLKDTIELILEERLASYKKDKKKLLITKGVSALHGKLK